MTCFFNYIHICHRGLRSAIYVILFTFQLMDDGKLLPMGAKDTDYTDQDIYCSKTSTNSFNGIGCTQRALSDENFWK